MKHENRDYLFGQLLATIELWERQAIGQKELTQAEYLQGKFSDCFARAPLKIYHRIYLDSAKNRENLSKNIGHFFDNETAKIMNAFARQDFNDNKINGEYLLGYYHQKSFINKKFAGKLKP